MTTNKPAPNPDNFQSKLTPEQHAYLLRNVSQNRLAFTNGQTNMEAYEIRAHLNRIFGFGGWDGQAELMELVNERWTEKQSRGKSGTYQAVTVVYRCRYTLTVRAADGSHLATYTEWAMGDAINFSENNYGKAHDFAMKTAESQAFKRCTINLGDQFGLSLYGKGSTDPLVRWTMVQPPANLELHEHHDTNDGEVPDVVPETDPDAPNIGEESQEEVYTPTPLPRDEGSGAPPLSVKEIRRQFDQHYTTGGREGVKGLRALLITARNAQMDEAVLGLIRNAIKEGEDALGISPEDPLED